MIPEEAAYALLVLYDAPGHLVPKNKGLAGLQSAFEDTGHNAATFDAGLRHAVERGWLEKKEHSIVSLTKAGFEEIERRRRG
ncbi:MAG TPA: hypothetical protein VKB71_16960 [Rhizomicrobium sp.]|nr:hypothetical protein [Rhizomicrobium sp.]